MTGQNLARVLGLLVAAVIPAAGASAAVLNNPVTVSGADAIDPAGGQTVDQNGAPAGSYVFTDQAALEALGDFQAVQTFTGFTAGTNIISFSDSSEPDIQIGFSGPHLSSDTGAEATNSAYQLRMTSPASAIGFSSTVASGVNNDIVCTITFGDYTGGTFTPGVNSVAAVGFTIGDLVANQNLTVDFKDAGGAILSEQSAAGTAADDDNGTGKFGTSSGSDVYFGYQSGSSNIGSVVITRWDSFATNQNIAGTLDDIGFTSVPEPATLGLIGLGILGLMGGRRRRGNRI